MIEPSQVASCLLDCMADGKFLVLPHTEVATYMHRKATDPDRWLRGMRRLNSQILGPRPKL